MPSYQEYWGRRSRGLCTDCADPAGDKARCPRCQQKRYEARRGTYWRWYERKQWKARNRAMRRAA